MRQRLYRAMSILISALVVSALLPLAALGADAPAHVDVAPLDVGKFPEVNATVVVRDAAGLPIPGLASSNFELAEDGQVVPATSIQQASTNQGSIGVALVLDASGSMKGKPLSDAVGAIDGFVNGLGPSSESAAIRFGGANGCQLNPGPGPTSDHTAITSFLAGSQAAGNTPLYDATLTAIQQTLKMQSTQRMVVVVTDGEDTCSKVSIDTVTAAAVRNAVPLYFIGLGPELNRGVLEKMAGLTGGAFFPAADSSKLAAIYQDLNDRLHTDYLITYNSTRLADRAPHTLTVRVKTDTGTASTDVRFTPPILQPRIELSLSPNQQIVTPVAVDAQTTTPVHLVQAQFSLDGTPLQTVTRPPLTYIIGPTDLTGGPHTLTVSAEDATGGQGHVSVPVSFVPPRVQLSVTPNQAIDKPTRVEVSTVPPVPLASAEFFLDATPLQVVSKAPLAYTIDPSVLGSGSHTLKARVTDPHGNVAEGSVPIVLAPTGLFAAVPFWAVLVLLLIIVAGAIAFAALQRRRRCPTCGREMAADWVACPYCTGDEHVSSSAVPSPPASPASPAPRRPLAQTLIGQTEPVARAGAASARGQTQILTRPVRSAAWLVVSSGAQRGLRFQLNDEETMIGRDATSDVVLDDSGASRQHAKIRQSGGAYQISDLDTTNGTLVNAQPIVRHKLSPGDVITIGQTELTFMPVLAEGDATAGTA